MSHEYSRWGSLHLLARQVVTLHKHLYAGFVLGANVVLQIQDVLLPPIFS